jgi:hypothetical protein
MGRKTGRRMLSILFRIGQKSQISGNPAVFGIGLLAHWSPCPRPSLSQGAMPSPRVARSPSRSVALSDPSWYALATEKGFP